MKRAASGRPVSEANAHRLALLLQVHPTKSVGNLRQPGTIRRRYTGGVAPIDALGTGRHPRPTALTKPAEDPRPTSLRLPYSPEHDHARMACMLQQQRAHRPDGLRTTIALGPRSRRTPGGDVRRHVALLMLRVVACLRHDRPSAMALLQACAMPLGLRLGHLGLWGLAGFSLPVDPLVGRLEGGIARRSLALRRPVRSAHLLAPGVAMQRSMVQQALAAVCLDLVALSGHPRPRAWRAPLLHLGGPPSPQVLPAGGATMPHALGASGLGTCHGPLSPCGPADQVSARGASKRARPGGA
jgi:hypothetical protein